MFVEFFLPKAATTSSGSFARSRKRESQVLDLLMEGHPSKSIATALGIHQCTVENLRGAIMRKTGSKSHSVLTQLVNAAAWSELPNINLRWNSQ